MHRPGLCLLPLAGCLAAAPPDQDVFDHRWAITIESVHVAATEPDGTAWDLDGSPPDPYGDVFFRGNQVGTTQKSDNSFDATWDYALPTNVIQQGDTFWVEVYDSDDIGKDTILICPGQDAQVAATDLRAGEMACDTAGSTLTVRFDMAP